MKKVIGLNGYGLEIVKRVPIEIPSNSINEKYLKTKRDKLGHFLLVKKIQSTTLRAGGLVEEK